MDIDSLSQEHYWPILLSSIGVLLLVVTLSGCYRGSRREFSISATVSSETKATTTSAMISTYTPIPTSSPPTPISTWTPTPAAPPAGTVVLDVVDVSQAPITLPVRGRLLVEICRKRESLECEVGLLDLENAQFIRLWSLTSSKVDGCSYIYWSPDGIHFVCRQADIVTSTYTVFSLASKTEYFIGTRSYGHVAWSPDGRYLVFKECEGHYPLMGYTYSVYDASTWRKVASIGWTHPMASCVYNSPIQSQFADQYCNSDTTWDWHSQPTSGLYCRLPLEDGRGWLIAVGHRGLSSMLCASPEECPDIESAKLAPYLPDQFQSERYQAMIENYWLRLIDTKTGAQRTYVIPGYRITIIAWSPD